MNKLKKTILGVLICGTLFMGILYTFQEKMIFLPEKIEANYSYNFPFDFEEINLTTEDNETINALHIKAENPKGIVLFFHGNKGNLIRWGEITSYFTQYQYDVFVMDYRGYGKSTGAFNESAMYKDALLSYNYVQQQFNESQIVVYGRSLGTTFAAKVGAMFRPKHIVLEAPFYSLQKAANHRYKMVPNFMMKFKFRTNQLAPEIKSSVTIFHGTDDKVTAYKDSQQLFALLTTPNKKLVLLEKGSHHNVRDFQEYTKVLKAILNE